MSGGHLMKKKQKHFINYMDTTIKKDVDLTVIVSQQIIKKTNSGLIYQEILLSQRVLEK